MIDEYGFPDDFEEYRDPDFDTPAPAAAVTELETEEISESHTPMREDFPVQGSAYLGGTCDGWEYRTVFGGSKLVFTFEMVKNFLHDEGYGNVPLPANAEEMKLFKRPRFGQQALFGERGYIHNPIKILFPADKKMRNALILCVYNEKMPGHLLRFHGL